jgi:hypothetical protein
MKFAASMVLILSSSAAFAQETPASNFFRYACTSIDNDEVELGSILILDQIQTEYVDRAGVTRGISGSNFLDKYQSGEESTSILASLKIFEGTLGENATPEIAQTKLDAANQMAEQTSPEAVFLSDVSAYGSK